MENEDAMKLEPGQKVIHRRYGVCIVQEILRTSMPGSHLMDGALFRVVIRPDNKNGRELLLRDCGCDIPDVLEDRPRNLSIEKRPGYKPIEHEMVWGIPEEDMLPQEPKNHFARFDEKVEYDIC